MRKDTRLLILMLAILSAMVIVGLMSCGTVIRGEHGTPHSAHFYNHNWVMH